MLAGVSALFYACGDSSSSNGTSGNDTYEQSGTFEVNEAKSFLSVYVKNEGQACVYEDLDYSWKSVNFGVDTIEWKYEFVGDTLVLYNYDSEEDEASSKGYMYVGGKAGNLNGTWKKTLCEYDSRNKNSFCFEICKEDKNKNATTEEDFEDVSDLESLMEAFAAMASAACLDEEDMEEYPEVTLKISGNSYTSITKYNVKEEVYFDDFMNSRFMTTLYKSLMRGDVEISSIYSLFEEDSAGVEDFLDNYKKYDVEVLNQTKTSIKFKIKDETLSINVKNASIDDDMSKLSLEVASNKMTCSLTKESGYVSKSACKAENGEYFDKTTRSDSDGNRMTIVYDYSKSNAKDFDNCTEDLMDSLMAAITPSSEKEDVGGDDPCGRYLEQYYSCSMSEEGSCSPYLTMYSDCAAEYSSNDAYSLFKKSAIQNVPNKKKFIKDARKLAYKLRAVSK